MLIKVVKKISDLPSVREAVPSLLPQYLLVSGSSNSKDHKRKRVQLEQLESRTLYSVDPISVAWAVVGESFEDSISEESIYWSNDDALANLTELNASRLEIVFIDVATPDYELLQADLLSGEFADRSFEIVLIDSDQNGIQIISDKLAGHTAVSAVHLISHGSHGNVHIGETVLSHATLATYEHAISAWGDSFVDGGDFLIYGCNFSATDSGRSLGAEIAVLANVDVASSDNRTGGSSVGGDWVLEQMVGTVETTVPFSDQLLETYQRSLVNTIKVTTVADTVDGNTSSFDALKLDPGPDGSVSLREAIVAANTQPGADTIVLPAGSFDIAITGFFDNPQESGDHDITSEITIEGVDSSQTIISAGGLSERVLEVHSGGDLSLHDVSIAAGFDRDGAAIMNNGTLNAERVFFNNNSSQSRMGGALNNQASATVIDSVFESSSGHRGGAIHNSGTGTLIIESTVINGSVSSGNLGGGLYNEGIATIRQSELSAGSSNSGSAIYHLTGDLILEDSSVSDNYALSGGGVFIGGGNATITGSTFSGNDANTGGAIGVNSGALSVQNSTFSDNSALYQGAGIYNNGGSVDISYSTFAYNSTRTGIAVYEMAGVTSIGNSIFTNSLGYQFTGVDIHGVSVSNGYNIIESTNVGGSDIQPTDMVGIDPQVLPLAPNGGPTETHALSATSPALDSGNPVVSPSTDQTGALRDAAPDIGAYESASTPSNLAPTIATHSFSQTFINEFHYDNDGIDTNENIEVVAPAGTDLNGWTLELHNGSASLDTLYDIITLSGTVPDEGDGAGVLVFPVPGIQNGAPDAIGLIDNSGNVVELISYEGTMTANSGAASGVTSVDVGVAEPSGNAAGGSLQRIQLDSNSPWSFEASHSFGAINPGQTIGGVGSEQMYEDDTLTFSTATNNQIVVADPDTSDNLQITVSVSAGVLAFSSTPGTTSASLTYTGTLSEINNELDGLTYTPDADFTGTDRLTVYIEDQEPSGSLSESAAIDVAVLAVNDAPNGTDNTINTPENSPITLAVADFGFRDLVDGDAFSAVEVLALGGGSLTYSGAPVSSFQVISVSDIDNGDLVFTPAQDASGSNYAAISFRVYDDGGTTNGGVDFDPVSNTIEINVLPVNHAPSGTDKVLTLDEDSPVIMQSTDFGFSDPLDGDFFAAVTITSLPGNGTLLLASNPVAIGQTISITDITNGEFSFSPANDENGAAYADFGFRVHDDGGTADGGVDQDPTDNKITFDVLSVNDAPDGSSSTLSTDEDTLLVLTASDFGFSDAADGDAFSHVYVYHLGGGSLALANVPVSAFQLISVGDIDNGDLVFTPAPNASGANYATISFNVQDDGGTANGGQNYDPDNNALVIDVRPVNDAPRGTDNTLVLSEDTSLAIAPADFGYSDSIEGDFFAAVSITSLPVSGTLTLAANPVTAGQIISISNITNGDLVFTPATNEHATAYADFRFRVHDDGGVTNGGIDQDPADNKITFDVLSVNDAPGGQDKTINTLENDTRILTAADFEFSDIADGDTFSAVEIIAAGSSLRYAGAPVSSPQIISIADIDNGDLVFTPAPNTHGSVYSAFTFRLYDDGGTDNGGTNFDPVSNTITFNVLPVNNAPSGTDNTLTIVEDSPVAMQPADFGFYDPIDGDFFAAVTIASLPVNGTLTLASNPVTAGQTISFTQITNGDLVFTPASNEYANAYDGFTFRVHDDGGTAYGGADQDPTDNKITFDVLSVNDAPAGADNTLVTNEDTPLTIQAADFGYSDPLDGDNFAAVTITVLPVNGVLELNSTPVTAGQMISITSINNGELFFVPGINEYGTGYSGFDFQVHDDGGVTNGGIDQDPADKRIIIDVRSVNDEPSGTDTTISTNENIPLTLKVADFGFSDPIDGNTLDSVDVTPTGSGTLTLAGVPVTLSQTVSVAEIVNGDLVFTPAPDTDGVSYAVIDFQVFDDGGVSNGGIESDQTLNSITIDVFNVNSAPHGTDNTIIINEDSSISFQPAYFGFADPVDGNAFAAVTIDSLPANGALELANNPVAVGQTISITSITNGDLVFTPVNNEYSNTYAEFNFLVHDNGGIANGGVDQDQSANRIVVKILSVNDAPDGANKTLAINEDASLTITAADFGFTDSADGDNFAAVTVLPPTNGSLLLAGTPISNAQTVSIAEINSGDLLYTPAPGANGINYAAINFQVRDDGGIVNAGIDTDPTINTITIDVQSVNNAPSGTDAILTVTEDSTVTIKTADFGFSDPIDGDFFAAVTITSLPATGTLALAGSAVSVGQLISITDITSGNLVYTTASDDHTNTDFGFLVHDDGGVANDGVDQDPTANKITFDVLSVNDAPVGTDTTKITNEDTALTLTASDFGFSDLADGDGFLEVVVTPSGGGSLSLAGVPVTAGQVISITDIINGDLVFTPTLGENGTNYASINFQVRDDGGTANGGIDTDQTINTIAIDVQSVNNAPSGTDNILTVNEDSTVTIEVVDFGFSDPIDGDFFAAVTITSVPVSGTLALAGSPVSVGQLISITDITNGDLIYTPASDDHTNTDFGFQVHDDGGIANGGVDQDPTANKITFDVLSVNDAPAGTDTTKITNEDTALTLTASDFGFSGGADGDGFLEVAVTPVGDGSLTLAGVPVAAGQAISVTDIISGDLVFTPAPGANGTNYASINFQVRDDGGTANGGIDTDQTINTITIDVQSVNNAPGGADSTLTVNEDSTVAISAADFGFSDLMDGNKLAAVTIATLPNHGTLTLGGAPVTAGQTVSVTDISNDELIFEPDANDFSTGYASFDFLVQDDGGTANGGIDQGQTPNTINIDVLGVNDAPQGADNTLITNEDTALVVQSADFGFADPADSDFFAAVTVTTLPANGVLALNGTPILVNQVVSVTNIVAGELVFTPVTEQSGLMYSAFEFLVHDSGTTGNGGENISQTESTLTFNVLPVNDAPVGLDSTLQVLDNSVLTLGLTEFGFTDTENHTLQSVLINTVPANGTLRLGGTLVNAGDTIAAADIASGAVEYVPAANTVTQDTIEFTVTDTGGTLNDGSNTSVVPAKIIINTLAVNDPPTATDSAILIDEDSAHVFGLADFGFSDPLDQHDFLSLLINAHTGKGTLTIDGVPVTSAAAIDAQDIDNGLLVFTPDPDGNGGSYATIEFNVRDDGGTPNGGQDTSLDSNTITLSVIPVNDEPQGSDATYTLLEDQSFTLSLADLGYLDPADNHALQNIVVTSPPQFGQLLNSGISVVAGDAIAVAALNSGDLRFVPSAGASGVAYDAFSFQVQDDGGVANSGVDTDQTPAVITFNVTPVSDEPAGTDGVITTSEDTDYTFALTNFGFSDPSDAVPDQLDSIAITQAPVSGALFSNGILVSTGDSISANDIASGNFHYVPAPNTYGQAFDHFYFRVADTGSTVDGGVIQDQSDNQILFDITGVSDAPAGSDAAVTLDEDTSYPLQLSDFGFSDSGDGDLFAAITVMDVPQKGALTLAGTPITGSELVSAGDIGNGQLVFTPLYNESGSSYANFSFLVHDTGTDLNGGKNVSQSPNITVFNVLPVNDAPVGLNSAASVTDQISYVVSASDFPFNDQENHALQGVRIDTLPVSGTLELHGANVSAGDIISAADLGSGALLYRPALNVVAQDVIGFTAIDAGGTSNGGSDTQLVPARLTFTTLTVNDPPVAENSTLLVNEDSPYTIGVADFAYADPAEQNGLSEVIIESFHGNGTLTLGGASITSIATVPVSDLDAGQLVYTPAADDHGASAAAIEFRVRDDGGATNGGQDTSGAYTLTIDIAQINDAPAGSDTVIDLSEHQTHVLTEGDFGFSDAEDSHRFVSVIISSLSSDGRLINNGQAVSAGEEISVADISTGLLSYEPAGADGSYQIGFHVKDSGDPQHGLTTDQLENTIVFDLIPINDPPALINQGAVYAEGSDNTVSTTVLAAIDPDDPAQELLFMLQNAPENGQLTIDGTVLGVGDAFTMAQLTGNQLHYSHDGSETDSDYFDFSLSDGGEDGVVPITARFNIDITDVVDPVPPLSDNGFTVAAGERFDSASGDRLNSDDTSLLNRGLLGREQLEIEIVQQPSHGELSLNPNGTFLYQHDGSNSLEDFFIYRVINEDGASATARINILAEPITGGALDAVVDTEFTIPSNIDTVVYNNSQPVGLEVVQQGTAELEPTVSTNSIEEKSDQIDEETNATDPATDQQSNYLSEELIMPLSALASDLTGEQLGYVANVTYNDFELLSGAALIERDQLRSLEVRQHNLADSTYLFEDNANTVAAVGSVELRIDPVSSVSAVVNNKDFLRGLSQAQANLEEAERESRNRVEVGGDVTIGVSISTTAGILAWMLRGGALFGSLMAATPLWSSIDPFRITDTRREDAEHDRSEVEDMFD